VSDTVDPRYSSAGGAEKSQVPRHGGEKGEKREKREEKRGKKGGRKEGR
jgi:hypothetical protein